MDFCELHLGSSNQCKHNALSFNWLWILFWDRYVWKGQRSCRNCALLSSKPLAMLPCIGLTPPESPSMLGQSYTQYFIQIQHFPSSASWDVIGACSSRSPRAISDNSAAMLKILQHNDDQHGLPWEAKQLTLHLFLVLMWSPKYQLRMPHGANFLKNARLWRLLLARKWQGTDAARDRRALKSHRTPTDLKTLPLENPQDPHFSPLLHSFFIPFLPLSLSLSLLLSLIPSLSKDGSPSPLYLHLYTVFIISLW